LSQYGALVQACATDTPFKIKEDTLPSAIALEKVFAGFSIATGNTWWEIDTYTKTLLVCVVI
jgi:hypothetical protein